MALVHVHGTLTYVLTHDFVDTRYYTHLPCRHHWGNLGYYGTAPTTPRLDGSSLPRATVTVLTDLGKSSLNNFGKNTQIATRSFFSNISTHLFNTSHHTGHIISWPLFPIALGPQVLHTVPTHSFIRGKTNHPSVPPTLHPWSFAGIGRALVTHTQVNQAFPLMLLTGLATLNDYFIPRIHSVHHMFSVHTAQAQHTGHVSHRFPPGSNNQVHRIKTKLLKLVATCIFKVRYSQKDLSPLYWLSTGRYTVPLFFPTTWNVFCTVPYSFPFSTLLFYRVLVSPDPVIIYRFGPCPFFGLFGGLLVVPLVLPWFWPSGGFPNSERICPLVGPSCVLLHGVLKEFGLFCTLGGAPPLPHSILPIWGGKPKEGKKGDGKEGRRWGDQGG